MSELKAETIVPQGTTITLQMYPKAEADKVIADLEESRKKEVEQLLMKIVELKKACNDKDDWCLHTLKENRHQKYKRCLAMAGWCEATSLWCYQAANTLPTGFHATLFGKPVMIETDRLYNRFELLMKWRNRWLKIAEQFKE